MSTSYLKEGLESQRGQLKGITDAQGACEANLRGRYTHLCVTPDPLLYQRII